MEAHGDEDFGPEPTYRDLEVALAAVVECILDHGKYPAKGRGQFDLYNFLSENRDSTYMLEVYVASLGVNTFDLRDRIDRERKIVEKMLIEHLTGSEMVADHAAENAE